MARHAFRTGISNFLQFSPLCPNSPEGIEALCSDMSVEHTDVRILMFAWYVIYRQNVWAVFFSLLALILYLKFVGLCISGN